MLRSKIFSVIEQNTFILHVIECITVILFTFFGAVITHKIVNRILPMRIREDQEERGIDLS